MSDTKEGVPPQLVGEIVSAVRLELAYWIPAVLAPLVEDLKKQSAVEKEPEHNNFCTKLDAAANSNDLCLSKHVGDGSSRSSPDALHPIIKEKSASLGSAGPDLPSRSHSWHSADFQGALAKATATAAEKVIIASSKSGDEKVCCPDAGARDQDTLQHEKTATSADWSSMPTNIEIEMSKPLIAPVPVVPPAECSKPREALLVWPSSLENALRNRSYSGRDIFNDKEQGDYRLLPQCDSADEAATFPHLMGVDIDADDSPEINDPEAAKRLPREIASLEVKAAAIGQTLEDMDALFRRRRQPDEDEAASIRKEIEHLHDQLELAKKPKIQKPIPPGPVALKFIESGAFHAINNLVVVMNLAVMIFEPKFEDLEEVWLVLEQSCVLWYTFELLANVAYYQRIFFFGEVSVVWWHWLDLGIVISGVIDEWFESYLVDLDGEGHLDIDSHSLHLLHTLRLFRMMRVLKLVKAFVESDLAWTESTPFELLVAGVVALNSVVMSLELDYPWAGWVYVENFFQMVYTFELAARLKRHGCKFFVRFDDDNLAWNYIDLINVSGGALDLWAFPLIETLWDVLLDRRPPLHSSLFTEVLRTLKMMRVLRVLRLVRLLKVVRPLYTLITGVMESIRAMQWVVLLTFLLLYGCAIIFTDLVGEGLLTDGKVSDSALEKFGSVSRSLFHLFQLMSGDISVVEPVTHTDLGRLLFLSFTVILKWAILAILTSVVSDNMINASNRVHKEFEQRKSEDDHEKRIRRLSALFDEIDRGKTGFISTEEWQKILEDKGLHRELCDAAGMNEKALNDYFECVATDPNLEVPTSRAGASIVCSCGSWFAADAVFCRKCGKKRPQVDAGCPKSKGNLRLDYRDFIEALKDEDRVADKRSILHVMKQLRVLESHLKQDLTDADLDRAKKFEILEADVRHLEADVCQSALLQKSLGA